MEIILHRVVLLLVMYHCIQYSCQTGIISAVDGGWGDWTEYGECTETCGVGKQLKSRQCNNPTPQNGGAYCTGITEDYQECNQEPCLVDGGWGDWTEYGECTETCGVGKQLKSRLCNNPTPQNGGADCTGITEDYQECNQEPCLVDGGWGDWTEYGECTETCGVGKQLKSRQCNNPTPQNGGADCTGITEDYQECNQEPCLGITNKQ